MSASELSVPLGFARRVRRGSPVRMAVEGVETGDADLAALAETCVLSLVDAEGRPWRERAAAAAALSLSPDAPEQRSVAVDALHQTLDRELWQTQRPLAGLAYRIVIPLCLAQGVAAVVYLSSQGLFLTNGWLDAAFGGAVVAGIVACVLCFVASGLLMPALAGVRAFQQNRIRAAAAWALGRLGVSDAAGSLAEAVLYGTPGVARVASVALLEVLPNLTPAAYDPVDPETPRLLCRLLGRKGPEADLLLLEALGKVGGGGALADVERQARSARTEAVRAAAERIIPRLRERRDQERHSGRLLRPARPPRSDAKTLVRPAPPGASGDEQLLVRPVLGAGQDDPRTE